MPLAPQTQTQHKLPPACKWLLAFQACNSVNFTVALGAPLVLVARHLGAAEGQIGILNGLAPFLVALQILGLRMIERVGYRKMMLAGWGTRSFMLLFIAPLPLLADRLPAWALIGALMFCVFMFGAIRGFATGAWLPWLHSVLPESLRGYYVGLEQRVMNISGLVTLIGSGAFLGRHPEPWKFSVLFLFAFAIGMLSVYFLRKTPHTPPPESVVASSGNGDPDAHQRSDFLDFRGWLVFLSGLWASARSAWTYAPLRRVVRFSSLYTFAFSALPGFLVLFLRGPGHWQERLILWYQAVPTIGILTTAVAFGRWSDRMGSRPMLRLADTVTILVLLPWILAAAGLVPLVARPGDAVGFVPDALLALARRHDIAELFSPAGIGIVVIFLLTSVFTAMHTVAVIRLLLGACPPRDRTTGMMVYQVATAVAGGAAPVVWGALIEGTRNHGPAWLREGPRPYLVLFVGAALIGAAAVWTLRGIREQRALSTREFLVEVFWNGPTDAVAAGATRIRRWVGPEDRRNPRRPRTQPPRKP